MEYVIDFDAGHKGTNHRRYAKLHGRIISAENDLEALEQAYDLANTIEARCRNLLPTDTCIAQCLFSADAQHRNIYNSFFKNKTMFLHNKQYVEDYKRSLLD